MAQITFIKTCRQCGQKFPTFGKNAIHCSRACYFWYWVDKSSPNACWLWKKPPSYWGYGQARWNKKSYRAHRLSWEINFGPIPHSLLVCHKCDNRMCCNPSHLFVGTQADNIADMVKKGRNSYKTRIGEEHKNAKLNDQKVREIKKLLAAGFSLRKIAKLYNVSGSVIFDIKRKKKWRHVDL
jgi:hypothetical protein